MSRTMKGILLIVFVLALVPFGLIALSRSRTSEKPPVHLILDMDKQVKFKPQALNPMFADDRAMRPEVRGTLAGEDLVVGRETLNGADYARVLSGFENGGEIKDATQYAAVMLGRVRTAEMSDEAFGKMMPPKAEELNGDKQQFYVRTMPVTVSKELMLRGQERFNIYCAPCHGYSGYGDGMVARRAAEFQQAGSDSAAGWVAPTNYHTDDLRNRPVGSLFNTITNGVRSMPRYDKQISVLDRWAIAGYVKALQRSQNAKAEDVPEVEKDRFK